VINESLFYFRNPTDFSTFIEKLNIYNDWKIGKGTMNTRGESIRNKGYTRYLRDRFNNKNMFRRSVSISEIVSWLDSFVIMKRLFDKLRENIERTEFDEIELYCEYVIKLSKNMRVDFVIRYKKIILIIEFRMVNNFSKIKTTWNKKKLELLVYKELMENYIETDFRLLTFAFISLYEYDGKVIESLHFDYNNNQVDFLVRYLVEFVIKKQRTGY
jgi:hypothetical protein